MNPYRASSLMRALRDENAQALPFMAMAIVLFFGMAGLTIDVGHAYVCYQELQASTDAAALAAGYALAASNATSTTVTSAAQSYSSVSGGVNVNPNITGASIATTLKCLTTVTNFGIPCAASATGDNSVQVVQTATVTPYFIQMLKMFHLAPKTSLTINAEATAAMKGATNSQYNVAIVIDTTNSMGQTDPDKNCTVNGKTGTAIQCALQGVQVLLNGLTPCSGASTPTSCKSAFDSVALFTFPNVTESTAAADVTCNAGSPKTVAYSVPSATATTYAPASTNPSYELTIQSSNTSGDPLGTLGFLTDYSATNAYNGGLNTTSQFGIALGQDTTGKSCTGLQAVGGQGTYLAGAIYAAQAALTGAQTANPGSQNAMIVLSDGNANATNTFQSATGGSVTLTTTGLYPSMIDQCEQAVTAAKAATSAGTTVYVVAYDSPTSGGCTTDSTKNKNGTGIQPCAELTQMASAPADFFSDATTANNGACQSSAHPGLNLTGVFTAVTTSFTNSRLIPNGSS